MRVKKRRSKIKQLRDKRVKGKFKKIGIFFIIFGLLILVISGIFYSLYQSGELFMDTLYAAPVPTEDSTTGKVLSTYNPTTSLEVMLTKAHISYSSVVLSADTYTIKLTTGETVLFSATKDIPSQISSLQAVVSTLTIEGKRFTRLDFRYDKPLINFK